MTDAAPFKAFPARLVRQFIRFGIVGASGVLVNMAVAITMNKAHGGTAYANAALFEIPGTGLAFRFSDLVWWSGFAVANVWNYQLNQSWTFRGHRRSWWSGLWPFMATGLIGAFVGFLLKKAMTNPSWPLYLPEPFFNEERGLQSREYWAQLISIFVTMPINFVVNKYWTFGGKNKPIEATDVSPLDESAEAVGR